MSEQQTFGAPYGQVQAPPPPPAPGYGFPPPPQKTNTMAILGLVFAFIFSPLGIVFSALGLKQIKERNEGGRGLAVTGLVLSIIFTIIGILMFMFLFVLAGAAVKTASDIDAAASSASQALASESAALDAGSGKADDKGVEAACRVIVPAAANSDIESATTPAEIKAKINALVTTMQSAAAGTTDPQFIADVQKLADDFNALSASMVKGQDPSSLQGALEADGTKVDTDCAAVGVSG